MLTNIRIFLLYYLCLLNGLLCFCPQGSKWLGWRIRRKSQVQWELRLPTTYDLKRQLSSTILHCGIVVQINCWEIVNPFNRLLNCMSSKHFTYSSDGLLRLSIGLWVESSRPFLFNTHQLKQVSPKGTHPARIPVTDNTRWQAMQSNYFCIKSASHGLCSSIIPKRYKMNHFGEPIGNH